MTKQCIGHIGVDAGICWIGDPCYILHEDKLPIAVGKDWGEFCENLYPNRQPQLFKSFNYDVGGEGLGVCVQTGYGDGYYPVIAKIVDGRVKEVTVKFF